MDPPHMTEFASDRYFEKLNQQRQSAHDTRHNALRDDSSSSTFILPLRDARVTGITSADHVRLTGSKRAEKGGRKFGLRQLLPKHLVTTSSPGSNICPSQSVSGNNTVTFEQLFFALPNELQVQILSALSLHDVLYLRLVSRSWHTLVTLHEVPITRYHLDCHIPAYALRLFPPTDNLSVDLRYLCGLWHRLHVAAKLSHLICEWATKEIFLRTTEVRRLEFAPQRERMRRRLVPLVFTIFHFFEKYRQLHTRFIERNEGVGLRRTPYTLNPIEVDIMSAYDDQTLLRVHQVFPLVIASFCRRLRPPTYVGRVERSFRGYLRERPADEVHVAILCVGGLRQVEKLWEIRGYNARRTMVDTWYNSILRPCGEVASRPTTVTKSRRAFMGIGRKKPVATGDGAKRSHCDDQSPQPDSTRVASFVFNTSLASGMPMSPLSTESLAVLLPDLPLLQHIWVATAETLILERKIVGRSQDIKRNTQVLFELIREDGFEVEDEWLYGSAGHESLRPCCDAMEDDPEGL